MKNKALNIFMIIVLLLSLFMLLPPVADAVGGVAGVAADKVTFWAKTIFMIALGLFLISSGVAALAVPVVGIGLIVIGLALITWSVWPLFGGTSLPTTKPDNTRL